MLKDLTLTLTFVNTCCYLVPVECRTLGQDRFSKSLVWVCSCHGVSQCSVHILDAGSVISDSVVAHSLIVFQVQEMLAFAWCLLGVEHGDDSFSSLLSQPISVALVLFLAVVLSTVHHI